MMHVVNGVVEKDEIGESPMREAMQLQVRPDDLDIVQLRGVFAQPFDGEPIGAPGQRRPAGLAGADRAIVEDKDDRLVRGAGFGAAKTFEHLQMRDEVGAPLSPKYRDDQLAPGGVERTHHRDILELPRRQNPQVRAALGPSARKDGMGQSFTFVLKQERVVAGLGLDFEQLQLQAATVDGFGVLTTFQRVTGPEIGDPPYFCSALEICDRAVVTPLRRAISSTRRGKVQLTRFITGADSKGSATRNAAFVFKGSGPVASRVFHARHHRL